jgi:hypothetical protein
MDFKPEHRLKLVVAAHELSRDIENKLMDKANDLSWEIMPDRGDRVEDLDHQTRIDLIAAIYAQLTTKLIEQLL